MLLFSKSPNSAGSAAFAAQAPESLAEGRTTAGLQLEAGLLRFGDQAGCLIRVENTGNQEDVRNPRKASQKPTLVRHLPR